MAGSLFGLFALIVIFAPQCLSAGPSKPERNPALAKYQNSTKCFPLQETWYSVYRNFKDDPALGGTAKCGRFSSVGPEVDGSFPMIFQYQGSSIQQVVVRAWSDHGKKVHNIQKIKLFDQNVTAMVFIAYVDCQECVLMQHTYVSAPLGNIPLDNLRYRVVDLLNKITRFHEDKACSLYLPESKIGKNRMCCDFIFDLLCGTTPRYSTYDESCLK